ncbi:PUA-like domain-containing protein [Sporodiniella umbellata]|nr:PUA-like domain-containing protein [Sporodiniella umbellata]
MTDTPHSKRPLAQASQPDLQPKPTKKQKKMFKECPSCLKTLQRPLTLPCGYTCCTDCHLSEKECAGCQRIHTTDIKPNVTLQTLISLDLDPSNAELELALECAICCSRLTSPATTPCGHTFCKECLVRSLDHHHSCPICRESVGSCPPVTGLLEEIVHDLYDPEQPPEPASEDVDLHARADRLPLLVGSLGFPGIECSVHVFEPRYRLMLRRIMQSPQRRFGLCLLNRKRTANAPVYHPYGTVLELNRIQTLPDGRSIVEAVGTYRFRVKEVESVDGYHVASFERVDDLECEQQTLIEQQQILQASALRVRSAHPSPTPQTRPIVAPTPRRSWAQQAHPQTQAVVSRAPWLQMHVRGVSAAGKKPQANTATPPVLSKNNKAPNELTTDELIQELIQFIQRMNAQKQTQASAWITMFGKLPAFEELARDKSKLIWWFVNVIPLAEDEKVSLLSIRTLRERALMVFAWLSRFNQIYSFNHPTHINKPRMPPTPCLTS